MPSIRVDKQIFPFFDSVKTPITAVGTSDSFHNSGFGLLSLEIAGDAAGYVEGCINIVNADGSIKDDASCSWGKLAIINSQTLECGESFDDEGHYCIGINGMSRVRIVLTSVTGSVTIVGIAEV